jgi:hypothetical protein
LALTGLTLFFSCNTVNDEDLIQQPSKSLIHIETVHATKTERKTLFSTLNQFPLVKKTSARVVNGLLSEEDFTLVKLNQEYTGTPVYIGFQKKKAFKNANIIGSYSEFYVFPSNNIDKSFRVTNRVSSGEVTAEIYEMEFNNKVYNGEYDLNGASNLFINGYINYGWWGDWDTCLGFTHSPFSSNAANVAFTIAADGSTLGMYTIAAGAIVCPLWASFQ